MTAMYAMNNMNRSASADASFAPVNHVACRADFRRFGFHTALILLDSAILVESILFAAVLGLSVIVLALVLVVLVSLISVRIILPPSAANRRLRGVTAQAR